MPLRFTLSVGIVFLFTVSVYGQNQLNVEVKNKADFQNIIKELDKEHQQKEGQLNNRDLSANYLIKAEKILEWAINYGNENHQNTAHRYVIGYYVNKREEAEIISRSKYLINQESFQKDTSIVFITRALLDAYNRTRQYEKMIRLYPKFYKRNKECGNPYRRNDFDLYGDLGMIYYQINNFSQAIEEFKKAEEGLYTNQDYFNLGSIQNNIALAYGKLYLSDSAFLYYDKALQNINRVKEDDPSWPRKYQLHFANVVASNKAKAYFQQDKSYNIDSYLFKALESSKSEREPHITRSTFLSIAEVNFEREDYVNSLRYLDSTEYTLQTNPHSETLKKVLQLKGRCYLKQGNIALAEKTYDRYTFILDSFDQEEALQMYVNAAVDFDTEAKETALLKSKIEFGEASLKNSYLRIGLIALIGVIVILILLINRVIKSRRFALAQKKQLHEALEDKNVLLKEIHHRVKNNLQIISGILDLQADKIDNPELTKSFAESQLQVQSIALVHQMLYELDDPSSVKMEKYLDKLSVNTIPIGSNQKINCSVKAKEIELSLEKATPIGLLTSELLINSIKHAFPKGAGNINIELKKNAKGLVVFDYKDDGIGFNSDFEIEKSQTLGISLVKMLAEEIGGELLISGENGIHVKIVFLAV
jgi:two-component system, sensor histidine kinase PdtaS